MTSDSKRETSLTLSIGNTFGFSFKLEELATHPVKLSTAKRLIKANLNQNNREARMLGFELLYFSTGM
ncbi:hypothetical protein TURTL08_23490 [Turicimonas sp. TL08]